MTPGRACPIAYRYSPDVFQRAADIEAETIYVIGGLYGNEPALDAILALAAQEPVAPTLVFNGDFNWFNVDDETFARINTRVLGIASARGVRDHIALRGNVETELAADADDAGCGCAYPAYVDDEDVERSNAIMRRLRDTARRFPAMAASLCGLPMHAVAAIGGRRVGIVHGDAESLAGWRFAHDFMHEPENVAWFNDVCANADLAGFASSHTCLPTFRRFSTSGTRRFLLNNGAAGMPNFAGTTYGLISRLSVHPAADGVAQYGEIIDGVHIDAIPVHYDHDRFVAAFLAHWPAGSPAHRAYFARIMNGPAYYPPHALGLVRAPSVCA